MAIPERRRRRARRKKQSQRKLQVCERPLLTVFRSSRHTYAQLLDPLTGKTITAASTRSPDVREGLKSTKDIDAASAVGAAIARRALDRQIVDVTFNRNGFVFHGRVKAVADAAREAGLNF